MTVFKNHYPVEGVDEVFEAERVGFSNPGFEHSDEDEDTHEVGHKPTQALGILSSSPISLLTDEEEGQSLAPRKVYSQNEASPREPQEPTRARNLLQ